MILIGLHNIDDKIIILMDLHHMCDKKHNSNSFTADL